MSIEHPPPLDEINGLDHVHLLGCDDRKAYCRTTLLRKGYTKCKDEDFQKLHLAKCAFGEEKEIKYGDLNEYEYHINVLRECAGAKLDSTSAGNLRMIELKSLISNRLTDARGVTDAFRDACESGQVDVVKLLLADVRVDPATRDDAALRNYMITALNHVHRPLQNSRSSPPTAE